MTEDTIFAVATGGVRAAISVVRVAGPGAHGAARSLAAKLPPPRVATLARLRDPETGETLDHALVLVFEAARSEHGEDGVEFHLHGSPAVVAAVTGVLARMPGLRAAEPGEFARRAFRNGKMDLAQVEGLADLIDAETSWQRRQAQRQLSGAMRETVAPWRAALIAAAALVETAIDFVEDVEFGESLRGRLAALLDPVRAGLRAELARGGVGERIRDGIQVVIAGPPNAGKSTLLNALARREAAIVSAVAGTTRDPIEVHLDFEGCPVTLVDTAGLRESADEIEVIGIRRARQRIESADLVLWLSEDETVPPTLDAPVWHIAAKADLGPGALAAAGEHASLALSASTGFNLDVLVARLAGFARSIAGASAQGLLARERHREAFEAALRALDEAAKEENPPVEIVAEHLRAARFALERLIGAVDVEDILDEVFSRFCIGK